MNLFALKVYDNDTVIYETVTEDPFYQLSQIKKRTFSEVFDKNFRQSNIRNFMKKLHNRGGEMKIEIEPIKNTIM